MTGPDGRSAADPYQITDDDTMTVFATRFEAIVCVLVAVVVLATASHTIGSATFLADQLDQIVSFGALLDGEAKALYGPVMSGTDPPAHSVAPVAAVLFGLPTALGLNPDQLHVLFLLLLTGSLVLFCRGAVRVDRGAGVLWTALLLLTPTFWWASSMTWLAIVQLWCSLAALAALAAYAWTPRLWLVPVVPGLWLAAVGTQLSSLVGWPVVVVFLALVARDRPWVTHGRARVAAAAALPAAMLVPYLVGELRTGFSNGRAVRAHLTSASDAGTHQQGLESAFDTLAIAVFPFRPPASLAGDVPWGVLLLWFAVLAGAAVLALRRLRQASPAGEPGTSRFWGAMVAVYLVAVPAQMAFYLAMNRPLEGPHYTLWLLPVYLVPYVLLVGLVIAWLAAGRRVLVSCALAAAATAGGVTRAGAAFAPDAWNFRAITAALTDIATRHTSINTVETMPAFVASSSRRATVLSYLLEQYVPGADVAPNPNALLVPERYGSIHARTLEFGSVSYALAEIVPPGIGVYVRDGTGGR